jgi:TPR repeat protein
MFRTVIIILFLTIYPSQAWSDFKSGGDAYKRGDYETAAKEFLPLAEKDDHRAMYALGSMYAGGNGVPQDFSEALKWFRKAVSYGRRPDAMYKIGLMYDEGYGVDANSKRALKWYGRSAKKGYGHAQFMVGNMYFEGRGVKQSIPKAYAWLTLAAENNIDGANDFIARLENEMSSEQLEKARKLTLEYRAKYNGRYIP